jgi:SPP1 gp7 family putative phage head morphogenesis protein
MKAYEREAKRVVAQADAMRAAHKHVTYDDFSKEVNQRMKVYNATMRLNRLELLKSQIGVYLTEATADVDDDLQHKLGNDFKAELIRQAGIMAVTATPSMWTSDNVAKIIMKQTGGANFSQRLWANQDALKARLDDVLATGIVQGQNPRKMAAKLKSQVKDTVENHRYVTERIARTESARVQYTAQIQSIKKNGYHYVHWFAEPKACMECTMIAQRDSGHGAGIYRVSDVPKIPDDTHPNCRCSISATWVDE